MKSKILLPASLLASALVLTLTACGGGSKDSDDSQSKSGACGFDVISDYNSVASACRFDDEAKCNSLKEKFLGKYPDVSCKAAKGSGLEKEDVQVTRALVSSLPSLDALAKQKAQLEKEEAEKEAERLAKEREALKNQNESGACGENVISDLKKLASECSANRSVCATQKETFLKKYPKISCTAIERETFSTREITINPAFIETI